MGADSSYGFKPIRKPGRDNPGPGAPFSKIAASPPYRAAFTSLNQLSLDTLKVKLAVVAESLTQKLLAVMRAS
jgi:hypothetical protein